MLQCFHQVADAHFVQEIAGFKAEAQRQQRAVWQLEREREKYGHEASESTARYTQARFHMLCGKTTLCGMLDT